MNDTVDLQIDVPAGLGRGQRSMDSRLTAWCSELQRKYPSPIDLRKVSVAVIVPARGGGRSELLARIRRNATGVSAFADQLGKPVPLVVDSIRWPFVSAQYLGEHLYRRLDTEDEGPFDRIFLKATAVSIDDLGDEDVRVTANVHRFIKQRLDDGRAVHFATRLPSVELLKRYPVLEHAVHHMEYIAL